MHTFGNQTPMQFDPRRFFVASPASLEATQQKDAHNTSNQCSCYGYLEGLDEENQQPIGSMETDISTYMNGWFVW